MKILRLLNKKFILFFLYTFFFCNFVNSNEPVDIWNIEKKDNEKSLSDVNENIKDDEELSSATENIKKVEEKISIIEETDLNLKKNYLVGLYDPSKNDLSINMWEFSDGEKISKIIKNIQNINLSNDAKEIYSNLILTNALPPKKNFSQEQFLNIKIDWLIKNKDLKLIEKFIIKNNEQKTDPRLLKFYLDQYLSIADLENACSIFSILKNNLSDIYISKYRIYCLINEKKKDIAQVQFELLKENGFEDIFFEKKFNFLMGYSEENESKISEKNLLEFHLSYLTDSNFEYIPRSDTKKIIWTYLSSFNLLENVNEVDLEDDEKILSIEKATHEGNYPEKDLLNLYTRYRFSVNQLISVDESFKLLSESEARALLYQGYLISKDTETKIQMLKMLKEQFSKNNIENAFNYELIKMLEQLDVEEIPSNYISFYENQLINKKNSNREIKFNSKIIHQSKLLNYFRGDIDVEKAQKELEKKLKKIQKKQKKRKYYFSTKDIILIESFISDGVKISNKSFSLLEPDLNKSNIPTDIEVMINDGEIAMILLRLVEIIGEDDLKNLGSETLYFIISTLNKLNIDKIRNNIILKVLPLKV